MTAISNILLRDARPDDRIHLLVWEKPNESDLQHLIFYNNAHLIRYRENLLRRIDGEEKFLALQHNIDRELEAIKSMCIGVNKDIILLEQLDCLISYLSVQVNSNTTLFWKNLENTRKLEKLLWILLPQKLVPQTWPETRLKIII